MTSARTLALFQRLSKSDRRNLHELGAQAAPAAAILFLSDADSDQPPPRGWCWGSPLARCPVGTVAIRLTSDVEGADYIALDLVEPERGPLQQWTRRVIIYGVTLPEARDLLAHVVGLARMFVDDATRATP